MKTNEELLQGLTELDLEEIERFGGVAELLEYAQQKEAEEAERQDHQDDLARVRAECQEETKAWLWDMITAAKSGLRGLVFSGGMAKRPMAQRGYADLDQAIERATHHYYSLPGHHNPLGGR